MVDFNQDKFKELLLYIAEKSQDDPKFGATKLNKILFFSDFLAYVDLGSPLTGASYQCLEQGPAPREFLPARQEMTDGGDLHLDVREYHGFKQKRIVPDRKADLTLFSPDEISLVDSVIDALRDFGAVDVSDLSHRLAFGWQVANAGQDIPYESAFLSDASLSENDILRGQELAAEHGWLAA